MNILPTDSQQTILNRALLQDSLLFKFINNCLLIAEEMWSNPVYQEDIEKLHIGQECPITPKTRKYVSHVLHVRYKNKEGSLKRTLFPHQSKNYD